MNSRLILGRSGQLARALKSKHPDSLALGRAKIDIADAAQVKILRPRSFDCIINAAAFTDVDGAESNTGKVLAWEVNATGPQNLAGQVGDKPFFHISSDYVFDGSQETHDEDEILNPINIYGETKAAGDRAVLSLAENAYILRTSWVVGDGANFVRTMMDLCNRGVNPQVVDDQLGRLTFTSTLVAAIDHLLETRAPNGVYNVTESGPVSSWAEVAKHTFDILGHDPGRVSPLSTKDYYIDKPPAAKRPVHGTLDLAKIKQTGFKPADWRQGLEEYIKEMS